MPKPLKFDNIYSLYYERGETLEQIGKLYGVTKERIRQVMKERKMPRIRNRAETFGHKPYKPRFSSLEDYVKEVNKLSNQIIRKYINLNTLRCSECGSKANVVLHHIKYPAENLEDLQPLCRVCHKLKHTKGMTLTKQYDLYSFYKKGLSYTELAAKYNMLC